ncbi:hypothetical protein SCALM49S_02166 [Streptomyces californicus]
MSAPARTGPGSAAARVRRPPAPAVSDGATTASAHARATPAETSQTVPVEDAPTRSPIRDRSPRSASSPVSGPASRGATIAAGTASSSASNAANEVIRPREPPRARSSSRSPSRSEFSSRATSSRAYAASSTSCTATIISVERDTRSARSSWSSTVGSDVRTVTPEENTGAAESAFGVAADASRSPSMEPVVRPAKSAVASQAVFPPLRAPKARTRGR